MCTKGPEQQGQSIREEEVNGRPKLDAFYISAPELLLEQTKRVTSDRVL